MKLIPPNHKVFFPRKLIFVDTESNVKKEDIERYSEHTLKLGVSIFVELDKDAKVIKREVFKFHIADEFWNWMIEHTCKNDTIYIYGHNLKYDAINLNTMEQLNNKGYEIPFPILNHKFIMSAFKPVKKNDKVKRTYKIKLVDTANFLMLSLKEIGKRFGIEKTEIDFKTASESKLFEYCLNDTKIVEIFILSYIRFLVANDLGSFKDTLASTSASIYRHSFLESIWYHSDSEVLSFERKAYFGGRTECFFKGDLPANEYVLYDVKSMYPYIMKTKELPFKHLQSIDKPSINLVRKLIQNGKYIIAECLIKTPDEFNPYPVRHLNNDKDFPYTSTLLFPKGKFLTFLHLPELEYAFAHNHIVKILHIEVYEKAILFDKFIDYFYNIKSNTNDRSEREVSKITMNSLYGWFAKRHYETEKLDIPYNFEGDVTWYSLKVRDDGLGYVTENNPTNRKTFHAWFGSLYRVEADGLTPVDYGNVALAGAVTAYARMFLFDMLKACGARHRWYCDTDSLVTDREGEKRIKQYIGNDLGQLEIELTFTHGKINCPKDYEFGDKMRLKGVSRLHRKLDNNTYEMLRFTSFKDYMRTGKHGTVTLDKKLKRVYNKGVVKSDGFIMSPTMKFQRRENVRIE